MPKKILFESAVHQFVAAAQRWVAAEARSPRGQAHATRELIASMRFEHLPEGVLGVSWEQPAPGSLRLSYRGASFYVRGDTAQHLARQPAGRDRATDDPVREHNRAFFDEQVREVLTAAGLVARGRA